MCYIYMVLSALCLSLDLCSHALISDLRSLLLSALCSMLSDLRLCALLSALCSS
jgi:hypothetical protein